MEYGEIMISTIEKLKNWMDETELKSGDPFALQCSDVGINIAQLLPPRLRGALYIMDRKFPTIADKLFAHAVAPHSVALYLQATWLMYKATGEPKWINHRMNWSKWLVNHANQEYSGYAWGIPFKWLMGTGVLAPENTPMSTVTPYCSDTFYMFQEYQIATSGANFILNGLKRVYEDDDKLCLSYSPLDEFMIVNVQAYCAAQLYRAYVHTGFPHYRVAADRLINFVLSEQNEDGSWYYWSKKAPSRVAASVDSLHQCYIMQGLYRCYLVNKNEKIKDSVLKCMEYCNSNLITDYQEVKKFPKQPHAYELIDAAEMVSTLDLIGEYERADTLLCSTISHFAIYDWEYGELAFHVNIPKTIRFKHKRAYFASWINPQNNIPYIRWGQSQLLYAMAQHVALQSGKITLQEIYL
jgi:hypothetical protein